MNTTRHSRYRRRGGFSLMELLVASMLTAILFLGMFSAYVHQRTKIESHKWLSDMQQNARSAIDILSRDIRNAGYGINVSDAELAIWVDWEPQLSTNPTIIDGGQGSDEVMVVGAFGNPETELEQQAEAGTDQLILPEGMGAEFNTAERRVIFLGGLETVRILDISGDVLTISSSPTTNAPLLFTHDAGSTVELVEVVRYFVVLDPIGYPNEPFLARESSVLPVQQEWQRLFATGFIDLQAEWDGFSVLFTVVNQSFLDEFSYTDAKTGDGYRTNEMQGRAFRRNRFVPR